MLKPEALLTYQLFVAARHTTSNRRLPAEKKSSQIAVLHWSPKKSKFDNQSPFLAPELKGAGFRGPVFNVFFFGCYIHQDLDKFD